MRSHNDATHISSTLRWQPFGGGYERPHDAIEGFDHLRLSQPAMTLAVEPKALLTHRVGVVAAELHLQNEAERVCHPLRFENHRIRVNLRQANSLLNNVGSAPHSPYVIQQAANRVPSTRALVDGLLQHLL